VATFYKSKKERLLTIPVTEPFPRKQGLLLRVLSAVSIEGITHRSALYTRSVPPSSCVVRKDKKEFSKNMKYIYEATNREATMAALGNFAGKWNTKYPYAVKS